MRSMSVVAPLMLAWLPSTLAAQSQDVERVADDFVIGEMDGDPAFVFGSIDDVLVLPDGSFVLLDALQNRLQRFSPDGDVLQSVGRAGQGPGEYYVPSQLALDAGGNVLLLDQGNRRIHMYDAELNLIGDTPLPGLVDSFCTMHGRVFIATVIDGRAIHEINANGEVMHSFAPIEEVESTVPERLRRMVSGPRSRGLLLCVPGARTIVHVARLTPAVTAFGADGSEIWGVTLPDYLAIQLTPTSRGTIAFMPDPKTGRDHSLAGAVALPDGSLVVQANEAGLGGDLPGEGEVTTWFVDPRNASARRLEQRYPRVMAVNGDLWFYGAAVPFPRLGVGGPLR